MHTFCRIIFVSHFCLTILAATINQFRCDYARVPEADGFLKFHEMPSNWNEARLRCHMEGAILASPLNNGLREAMSTIMHHKNVACAVFTGVHATFSKGDFASIEGTPLSQIPHKWTQDEPNNYEDKENCLVLLPDGTMGDAQCTDPYPYFCYKKNANMFVNGCGTTDPEYTLDYRTGNCYKFHRVPRTWSRAYMHCMAEGGYLAIINSETEATVLKELFDKNPGSSMVGNFAKDFAFVGFHDWTEHGEWRTIHGQTLREAGYDKFSGGEPNNATTGQFCGAIFRNALFDDQWCETRYAFICEKEINSLSCIE